MKNTRIKDIAIRAGVSIGTVDRVLHERGEVSLATREKIQQIIDEMDYRPNLLASSLASKRNIVFATFMPKAANQDNYWSKPQSGVEKAKHQLREYGVKIKQFYFEMEDSSSFSEEADKLILSLPDAVMLAPCAKREAFRFTQKLDELKIPYIFIDSILPNTHPISFVAQSSFDSGFLAAKLMDWGLSKGSVILLIHVAKALDNANHLLLREKGFLSFFNQHTVNGHKLLKMEISGKNEDEIVQHLAELGLQPCEVNGIFVTNSKVNLAANCFKKLCVTPKMIGYDLIPQNIGLLKEGKIDFLICQKPEVQAFQAIHLMFDHIVKKEKIRKENFTSIDLITRENINFYNTY